MPSTWRNGWPAGDAACQFVLNDGRRLRTDHEDSTVERFRTRVPTRFPQLPILDSPPLPAPRSQREKYGGLFYLGIAGLAILSRSSPGSPSASGGSATSGRTSMSLHDPKRPEAERIEAAFRLSRNPG